MGKKTVFLMSLWAVAMAGCTSVNVKPVAHGVGLSEVCIVNNPKVTVPDFIQIIRDGFSRNKLATRVIEQGQEASCEVTLTYTALRSWDFKTYLTHAELRLWRDGKQIGAADYHLRGKGGFALNKWASARSKMDPVIDQLLSGNAGN